MAANVVNPLEVGYAKEDDRVRPSRKWYLQPEPLPIILAILAHPSTRVTRATMGRRAYLHKLAAANAAVRKLLRCRFETRSSQ
jgi:hypothetical protein